MHVRSIALLLCLTTLAGCLGGGDADPIGSTTTTTTPSATQTTTTTTSTSAAPSPTTPPEPENRAPAIELSADAATHVLGDAFSFHLVASDKDGDDLHWFFDADGDGSEEASGDQSDLPKDVSHTYGAIGEYTATFTVSDGEESVDADVTVTVTKVPFQDFTVTFEGTGTGLATLNPVTLETEWVYGEPVLHTFEVPVGAGQIAGTLVWDQQGMDFDMYLLDPSGNVVTYSYETNLPTDTPLGGPGEAFIHDPGRILTAGTWTLEVWPYEAYESAYTATLDVKEGLAPVQRVLNGIAPPSPSALPDPCELAALGTSEHGVEGLAGRPYTIEPADLFAVFWGGSGDAAVMGSSGTIPDNTILSICAEPPAAPGEYTLTIG